MRRPVLMALAASLFPLAALLPSARAAVLAVGGSATPLTPSVVRDAQAGMHTLTAIKPQQQDTAVEPSIAVNPANPQNAVIGYQAGRVDGGCAQTLGYGVTTDGGQTWTWGPLPKLTVANGGTESLASDPVVAFGPNNTVYFSELMCGTSGLATSVSHDGGLTWSDPIPIPDIQTFPMDDKNWIIVDNGTGIGHHTGRLYLVWDDVAPVVALYSDDEAKTWNGPFVIYPGQGIGTMPEVMPNGDLAVVLDTIDYLPPASTEPEADFTSGKLIISVAHGAGLVPTGGPLVFTIPTGAGVDHGNDVEMQRAGEGLPTVGLDAATSRIYVAWQDARYRSDDANDIVVTSSDNEGVTWSKPVRVNAGPTDDNVEHFTPAIGVGPDGSVRIAYRTQKIGDYFADTYYQQSIDGGATWSDPLLVNTGLIPEYLQAGQQVPVRTDNRFAAFSRASAFLGDYSEVATTGSWTYVVRCEAYRLSATEPATFPPKVHHQRAWVAVIDEDGDGIR